MMLVPMTTTPCGGSRNSFLFCFVAKPSSEKKKDSQKMHSIYDFSLSVLSP